MAKTTAPAVAPAATCALGDLPHCGGYIPDPFDEHVVPFVPRASTPKKARRLPMSVMLEHLPARVTDQGAMGRCVGASLADAIESVSLRPRKKPDGTEVPGVEVEWSNLWVYLLGRLALYGLTVEGYETSRDSRVSVDTGAMIGATVRMVSKYGVLSASLWPDTNTAKFADLPPKSARDQAKRHLVLEARVIENHEALQQALFEQHPVVLGFDVPPGFGTDSAGNMKNPGPSWNPVGGHAVLAIGYDAQREFPAWNVHGGLRIRNSWGTGWGDKGHYWMPFSFFNSSRVSDCWAIVAHDTEA